MKTPGQTYLKNATRPFIVEVIRVTKTGRITFQMYVEGQAWGHPRTLSEASFDKTFPVFVANA